MKMTYIKAKELYKQGRIDEAWKTAKQDDGLLPNVTKEDWIDWMNENNLKK